MKRDGAPRTTVYLVRHGQVENHATGVYNGQNDVAITDEGRRQMRAVLERLRDRKIGAVYCSDLSRAVEGAEIIGGGLGLGFQALPGLRERNFGAWEGLTYDEIRQQDPDLFEFWRKDVTGVRPPGGGESSEDLMERVMSTYLPLVERHRGAEIVVVAHGGVNRLILAHALNLEVRYVFHMAQSFGCLNIVDYYDDGFTQVRLING